MDRIVSDNAANISVIGKAHAEAAIAQPISPTTDAPDWDKVPFDVACARCGEDLRGQTEPACSACALVFDWADAVPLEELICEECGYHLCGLRETRCPECGEHFTWEEVLAARARRKRPTFEYHWRTRPVRSFLTSMRLALRPKRLWQQVDIHDRPPTPGLVGLALVSVVLTACVVLIGLTFIGWVMWPQYVKTPSGRWVPGPLRVSQIWPAMLRMLPAMSVLIPAAVAWCVSSFLALMVFRQSMRLCKVRAGHVVRVWAYAVPLAMAWFAVAYVLLGGFYQSAQNWLPAHELTVLLLEAISPGRAVILGVGFGGMVIWSIRCGYRHYIGMRHAFWVALTTQVIAFLLTMTVLMELGALLRL